MQQGKKKKNTHWEGKIKPFLFTGNIILYTENPKNLKKQKTNKLINEFCGFSGYKIDLGFLLTLVLQGFLSNCFFIKKNQFKRQTIGKDTRVTWM